MATRPQASMARLDFTLPGPPQSRAHVGITGTHALLLDLFILMLSKSRMGGEKIKHLFILPTGEFLLL